MLYKPIATGRMLLLAGAVVTAIAFAAEAQTLTDIGAANPTPAPNDISQLSTAIASFTSGNWGTILNLAGGGNVTVAGNLGNTSNGSVILFVNGGTTATLQGLTAKSNAAVYPGDANYPNGGALQAQTNPFNGGFGTSCVSLISSLTTNVILTPIDQNNGSVFCRLIYP